MRDSKSSVLLLVSLILFLMSFVILCTWGYNAYYKSKEQKHVKSNLKEDSAAIAKATSAIANATRDSLQNIYAATIRNFDSKLDSTSNYTDSIRKPLDEKLGEFITLKNEIAEILKDKNNDADLGLARQKIYELQIRVDELAGKNKNIEQENKRLFAMLNQLSGSMNERNPVNAKQVVFEERSPNEKTKSVLNPITSNASNLFIASDLRLSALTITDNNKEIETSQAIQTDKLAGAFTLKNDLSPNYNAEVVVVVLQPDGRVLQKSSWESGTFSSNEGKKVYSCKMRFDYTKGESKKLVFSLVNDNYMRGNYIMQIYYNGLLIGKLSKILS